MSTVVINQKPDMTWAVLVDGEDIADSVVGLQINAEEAGKPATVTLRLQALRQTALTGEAEVVLDDDTARLLRRLGWTPPPEQPV